MTEKIPDIDEYNQRLAELENYISDNRLVSKEAQMSSLSGEGYKDPRFTISFDNPNIDKFALYPFAGEGSGYQPTTKEVGMQGPESILEDGLYGSYNPNTDVVMFKDVNKGLLESPYLEESLKLNNMSISDLQTAEGTQKHELIHRAVEQSGYLDFLPTSEFLKENSTTKYLKGRNAQKWSNLINEVLAESYGTTSDTNLEDRIKFRVSRFNIKEDAQPRISKELFENVDVLRKDFETYLESLMNPDELKATRMDEIMMENGI